MSVQVSLHNWTNRSKYVGNKWRMISTTTTMNSPAAVTVSQRGPINIITMDRPKQMNAMNKDMWLGLTESIAKGDADPSTNIIVLAGNPQFFCSGLDLAEHRAASQSTSLPSFAKNTADYLGNLATVLIDCKKLIVALAHGSAYGIGVTILPLCDFVYASDKSTFTAPFGRLGLTAECCSTYTFPKIMGNARAASVLFNNEMLTGQDALSVGLVSAVFKHDEFIAKAEQIIQGLLGQPLEAMMFTKKLIRDREREILHAVNAAEYAGTEKHMQSKETEQAVARFFEKKKK